MTTLDLSLAEVRELIASRRLSAKPGRNGMTVSRYDVNLLRRAEDYRAFLEADTNA